MRSRLRAAIEESFARLAENDGILFHTPNPAKESSDHRARKLHEVCINHQLAIYLQATVLPLLQPDRMFVDIEFNREGLHDKRARIDGKEKIVRPDIIIHNRRWEEEKDNFLVIECKMHTASKRAKEEDIKKVRALMKDRRFQYRFGLCVIYENGIAHGILFSKHGSRVDTDLINCH